MEVLWPGNSAKAKVISAILSQAPANLPFTIFDFGCGTGGEWPRVLSQHGNIHLIGYDPLEGSIEEARSRLTQHNVELFTSGQLLSQTFKADFVVSFSVLEHVYDRRTYLQTAKAHLAESGIFYLNYDDGHFRNTLDLTAPPLWPRQSREWIHNLLAGPLACVGLTKRYQKRIRRAEMDKLIEETGFRVIEESYSNLASLKGLYNLIPENKRENYMRLWLDLEEELNAKFLIRSEDDSLGDSANLWQVMASRTVVLRHRR